MMEEQSRVETKPEKRSRITRRTLIALPILTGTAWCVSRMARPWRPFEFLYGLDVVGPPIDYLPSGDPLRCFVFSGKVDYVTLRDRASNEMLASGWKKSPFELPPQITTFVYSDRGIEGMGYLMDIHEDMRAEGGPSDNASMTPEKGWV